MSKVKCPYCKQKAVLQTNSRTVHKNNHGSIWICEPCKAWVGCHKGTIRPKGTLANEETRNARIAAHRVFDGLWQNLNWSRNFAYKWLASRMCMEAYQAHIGCFDEEHCLKLIRLCQEFEMANQSVPGKSDIKTEAEVKPASAPSASTPSTPPKPDIKSQVEEARRKADEEAKRKADALKEAREKEAKEKEETAKRNQEQANKTPPQDELTHPRDETIGMRPEHKVDGTISDGPVTAHSQAKEDIRIGDATRPYETAKQPEFVGRQTPQTGSPARGGASDSTGIPYTTLLLTPLDKDYKDGFRAVVAVESTREIVSRHKTMEEAASECDKRNGN